MVTPVPELLALARVLGDRATPAKPLGPLTTYGVGGPAALYVEVETAADLEAVRAALHEVTPAGAAIPLFVLGRGSNLLVSDAGFEGVVLHLGAGFAGLELPAAGGAPEVRAGAALALPVLARRVADAGWSGLSWAVGVPGSVGGAVRMNAGGHGSDTASSLTRCALFDLAGSEDGPGEIDPAALHLAYRSSSLTATQVVVWAEFGLQRGDPVAGRAAIAEVVRWRREHQPGGSNAGSVFTNPPDDAAGRLVEAAGLKGHRLGTAQVSTKHANFIQADDGGSADDVARLIDFVAAAVEERLGVVLRPEVQMVGFDGASRAVTR